MIDTLLIIIGVFSPEFGGNVNYQLQKPRHIHKKADDSNLNDLGLCLEWEVHIYLSRMTSQALQKNMHKSGGNDLR